ncbi:MAG: hypothetical protein FWC36_09465 [Spirochaetes bacterium]|nr:hypothetical protein [Spirochaetota bacterium]
MKKFTFLIVFMIYGSILSAQTTTARDMINGMERPVPKNALCCGWISREGVRIFELDAEGPPKKQRQWFVQFGRTVAYVRNIYYNSARAAEQAATVLVNSFTREIGNPGQVGTELVWVTRDLNYRITLRTYLNGESVVRVEIQRFL